MSVAKSLEVLGGLCICALGLGCAAVAPATSAITGGSGLGASLEVHSHTTVTLDQGNFITLRTNLVGSSKGFKLLGFITFYPATLDKAMNRLYAQSGAQEGRPETLANLVIEHSGIYVILFSIPKVTARADLIEFLPSSDEEDNSSRALNMRPVSHKAKPR